MFVAGGQALVGGGQTGEASPGSTIGIDADPSGNTATSLGTIDSCISVATGDTFNVDLFITDVQELVVWYALLRYDPSLVNIIDRDVQMFLAAAPGSDVRDHSFGGPGLGGAYDLLAADVADESPHESGSGVLARLTVTALAPGVSPLTLQELMLWGYPFPRWIAVDSVANAWIAVDQACPGGPPPTFTPPVQDTDDDGFADQPERYMGTDPLDACPDDRNDQAWPPDIDNDADADIVDVLKFKPVILTNASDPDYDRRFDLQGEGDIDIVDVLLYKPIILTQCANP